MTAVLTWIFDHLPLLWLGFIMLGGGLIDLLWSGVVVLRAIDVRWDETRCTRKRIDLKKARRRRVSWPALGLPLFAMAVGLYLVQLNWSTLTTYTLIAIGWFFTAPLRKVWGLALARRVSRRLNPGTQPATSFWDDLVYYYGWGFDLPEKPEERVWFEDRLRVLNKLQKFWYVVQIWRFWGIFGQAALSLLWPVTAVCAVFYHLDGVETYDYARPWWRLDRREERRRPAQTVPVVTVAPTNVPPAAQA